MVDEDIKQGSSSSDQDELKKYKEQAEKTALLYAYLNADFENYKKRTEREKSAWIDQATDDVIVSMLPLMDDIERGLAEVRSELRPDSHVTGLELIAKSFGKVFAQYGIEEIPLTKTFDPHLFEAIMRVPSQYHVSGEVVAILRKGYTRKGKVLRPAEVSVAQ